MFRKIWFILFIVVVALSCFLPVNVCAETSPPDITAESAVVMDAETGQVVYSKNMTEKSYPASITKIMTALLAVEKGNMSDILTATESAVGNEAVPRDTTHIMLVDGEQMPLESLLYATMLPSANDAANVVAEYIGGSLSGFADMMNERAKEIGCVNTNFTNANGLPDDNHYVCAYDMALITKTALQNELFRKFFSAVIYTAEPTNKNTERSGATSHKMMKNGEFYYEGVTGGKTGWTKPAKYTCVTSARRNDTELICVLLGCETGDARFSETIDLFNYVFDNFRYVTLSKTVAGPYSANVVKDDYKISVAEYSLDGDITFLLENSYAQSDIKITASVPAEYTADPGPEHITLVVDGKEIATYPLELSLSTLDEPVFVGTGEVSSSGSGGFWNMVVKILVIIGIIILVLAVLFIIIVVYMRLERKKRVERRRRLKQRQQQNSFYFDDKNT